MWKLFTDYFSFTKKERKGIIYAIVIIIIVALSPRFFHFFVKDEPINTTEFAKEISVFQANSINAKKVSKSKKDYYDDYTPSYIKEEPIKKELFYFDPNTASENDWVRLGVRKKTAQTIQKYIAKGGKFYKSEDIRKIYGLNESDAKRLIPYVSIANVKKNFPTVQNHYPETNYYPKKIPIQPVDINVADTSAFIALPGIGSKLSKRIIGFREKLGGFYSVDQIAETYNLPDSTFEKIKKYLVPGSKTIKKININSATVEELKAHPYISFSIANAIVQFRQQHGNFKQLNEIRKIMLITDEFFTKATPYLAVE
ncbi:MAG: helix-hairpin-helix domain-containing protein [Ginsengibacter sp.]